MKRYLAGCMLLAFVLIAGCGSSKDSGYTVLFSEPVKIFDDTVYDNGVPIGKIAGTEISPANRSRMIVNIDPEFRSLLAQNSVFLINSGKLCLTTVAPFGESLEAEAMLPGFASKVELTLFRIKNIFADKVMAARFRTEQLADL